MTAMARIPGLARADTRPAALTLRKPVLLVVIDTEEEFDWSAPFSRQATGVTHVAELWRLQEIFEAARLVPTYLIDYPIAATPMSAAYFKDLAARGAATIGAHLHPWVTPPHEEEVSAFNSYPGNLPKALEAEKLKHLVAAIEGNVGVRPRIYKAGRYGVAADTIETLAALGFTIDCSTMPAFDLSGDGGPDFTNYPCAPYFIGPCLTGSVAPILEIATTGAIVGPLSAPQWSAFGRTAAGGALLGKLRLRQRYRLSPEGFGLADLQRVTRALFARGEMVFTLSLHSPSVAVGHTTYAATSGARDALIETVRAYMSWFLGAFGGEATTPETVRKRAGAMS